MRPTTARRNRIIIYTLAVLLGLFHQDFWLWANTTLLGGWLPIGLGYHAAYSVAAALLWAAAVKWAWPTDLEAWAEAEDAELATHLPGIDAPKSSPEDSHAS